ncbi:right-handed parallel beta-helix repeat-containing protein [Ferruginibacter sp.]|uniref:right-handed parallel beta-helix repeat-containing protein n=1 Tax=Ferruginibacter sp. TaxID=1940288 RepID=UPI002658754F|nr:right-handed parallel beta-helix repeat-containing protein [Ferruginibacter sp.]
MNSKSKAYYLSSTGDDNNAGTIKSPWKTIKKINAVTLFPGDSFFLKGGDSFNGPFLLDNSSHGKKDMPIVITSYGEGRAVLYGGKSSAIQIKNTRFVTIQNLELKGVGRKNGNTSDGLLISNSDNIIVTDLDVSGFRNAGVSVYTSSFVHITKVEAHENGFAGIAVSGVYQNKASCTNIYIGYCNAFNNPGSPVILDNHSGNGIVAGSCSKVLIEYCTATNNGWDMPRKGNGPVGIWCYEADSVTIQHCISYLNKTSAGGGDGGGFDLDGGVTNSIIQYCLSYQNQGSGYGIFQYAGASAWLNNIIRFNISENDGEVSEAGAGIYIWNSSEDSMQFQNCSFYNNTIYNRKGAAINYAPLSKRKGFVFYNNIFVAAESLLKRNKLNDIFFANDWWSIKNKSVQVNPGEFNIDPGFNLTDDLNPTSCDKLANFNRYKIAASSPLQNSGIDLTNMFGIATLVNDFNGDPAPVKGIGACFKK